MAATTSGFLGRAFEKYFFEFSMYDSVRDASASVFSHDHYMAPLRFLLGLDFPDKSRSCSQYWHKHISSKGQYIAL